MDIKWWKSHKKEIKMGFFSYLICRIKRVNWHLGFRGLTVYISWQFLDDQHRITISDLLPYSVLLLVLFLGHLNISISIFKCISNWLRPSMNDSLTLSRVTSPVGPSVTWFFRRRRETGCRIKSGKSSGSAAAVAALNKVRYEICVASISLSH